MIQVNELRIGNYVNYNDGSGKDDIREVVGIDKSSITSVVKGCRFATAIKRSSTIYAIPLTEEILMNCGFERKSYITKGIEIEVVYYQNKKIVIYLLSDFFEIEIVTGSGQFNLSKSFKKHLHQLQNLFYSLAGQELEVKL